jgi:hypothetical protein
MADICGPFTLEDLDQFNTSIDELAFSLDDPIWDSPDTCIAFGEGAVEAVGSLDVDATAIFEVSGSVNSESEFLSDSIRLRAIDGSINADGDVSAEITKQMLLAVEINAFGEVSALAGFLLDSEADIKAVGLLNAKISAKFNNIGNINANSNVFADLYVYGEEWSVAPEEENVWEEVADQSDVWTPITTGNNTWLKQG